jgi:hypothetical protein
MENKLRLEVKGPVLKSVATAAGRFVPIVGCVTFKLQLGCEGAATTTVEVTAHILPSFLSEVQLILGQDFLKSNTVLMGFHSDPARCTLLCPLTGKQVVLTRLLAQLPPPACKTQQEAGIKSSTPPLPNLPGQVSAAVALRLLKQSPERAFVALITPHLLASQPDAGAGSGSETRETACPPATAQPDKPKAPSLDHIPPDIRARLTALLDEFSDVFSETPQAGGALVDTPEHIIDLVPDSKPPFRRNRRLSPAEMQELRTQVTDLLAKGLITPSSSPFGAPVLFVPKPDGRLRFTLDFRELNAISKKLRTIIPRIDDLLDAARGAVSRSCLDLAGGYHQIRIAPEDIPKTAFSTPFGHYEWRVLPMGLTNAPAAFQGTMNKVFEPYLRLPGAQGAGANQGFVLVYLDDVLCLSSSPEEHLRHLRLVFEKLREYRLQAKFSKCKFLQQELKFLGHVLTEEGVKPDAAKIQTLLDWQFPSTALGLSQFLGLAVYFRKFIPNFSRVAAPLTT